MKHLLSRLRILMVPPRSALRAGVSVNIVRKDDQRSGRLTAGFIKDVFTSGDHPRGVKVRLKDGAIGRVQSLNNALPSQVPDVAGGETGLTSREEEQFEKDVGKQFQKQIRRAKSQDRGSSMGRGLQEDVRNDEQPAEEANLLDYVTVKTKQGKKGKKAAVRQRDDKGIGAEGEARDAEAYQGGGEGLQASMEQEFPKLDSGLIAAVVSDGPQEERVREVLKAVSS